MKRGREILTFGRYLRRRFGTRVAKVPLGLSGFTCPNIDGTVARGGCTFCLNESFSPNLGSNSEKFYLKLSEEENPILHRQLEELDRQIEETSRHFAADYGIESYLAYFQSFTNTYAPLSTLERLYERALEHKGVLGLSIGTRSDCISDETIEYLVQLSKEYEIWVEFGIQSVFDETLEKINRGHDAASVEDAIYRAKRAGLNVCGHLIFGLPGESEEMMLETASKAYEWGIDSVKYHPLYVVKNTLLANDLRRGRFEAIELEEYLSVLTKALKMKPEHISVQRVCAGIDNDTLLAPKWCALKKSEIMAIIRKRLQQEDLIY